MTSRTLAGLKAGLKTRPAYFLALLAAGCAALVLQAQELPKKTATAPYTTWSDYGGSADSAQ